MKKIITALILLSFCSVLFSQSPRDENTVDLRISNTHTDNGIFLMDIDLKRTSEWPFAGTWDNLLWNADFEFSHNTAGFNNQPQYSNLNSQLNTPDYTVVCFSAGNALTLSITGPDNQFDSSYSPPLDEWEQICTIQWNIADPSQNSEIEWSTTGTGLISAAGFPAGLLTNTYYGSGNISLLSVNPHGNECVLDILRASPNPFSSSCSSTNLYISSPSSGLLELNVYNVKGQRVKALYHDQVQKDQELVLAWDGVDSSGKELTSGVYFYQLLIGNKSCEIEKVLIIR